MTKLKNALAALFFLAIHTLNAQQTLNETLVHDGITREYILYVPASYDPAIPTPMLFNFHGYTQYANSYMNNTADMRPVADTAGFILVYPQGTLLYGISPHWNIGSWTSGSTADDVGFTSAMIDKLSTDYNVDLHRVYSCGFSNGGYFSFELACQLSDKIAAIGSVSGLMSSRTYNNCNPTHPTPVITFHGTSDNVVVYNGGSPVGTKSVTTVLDYWVDVNMANVSPIVTSLPDLNSADGSTVEHYAYQDGENCTAVEHYQVIGEGHSWPNVNGNPSQVNVDVSASRKIWEFVSKYNIINGLIECSTGNQDPCQLVALSVDDANIESNVYRSGGTISSKGTVASGSTVTFKAPNCITLEAGFQVAANSTFLAALESCSSNFQEPNKERAITSTPMITEVNSVNQFQVFPNPFKESAQITFSLEQAALVSLSLFNINGQEVKILLNQQNQQVGVHQFNLEASALKAGMYFVCLRTPDYVETKQLVLIN